jgi:hypothetical protein
LKSRGEKLPKDIDQNPRSKHQPTIAIAIRAQGELTVAIKCRPPPRPALRSLPVTATSRIVRQIPLKMTSGQKLFIEMIDINI